MLEEVNNREWAFAIWGMLFLLYVFLSPKMQKVKLSLLNLAQAFMVKPLIVVSLLSLTYVALLIIGLKQIGIWESHQQKNVLFWSLSIGIFSLVKIGERKMVLNHIKQIIIDEFKLTAIAQFILGVYTFGLLAELIFVPILIILSVILGFAKQDIKYQQVEKAIMFTLSIIGLGLVCYTGYMLVVDFGEFASTKTLYNLFFPPLISLFYIPYLLALVVYSAYEMTFMLIDHFVKNPNIRAYSKLYTILKFRFNLTLLERWSRSLPSQKQILKEDIRKSIAQIFRMAAAEKSPPKVPNGEGWSPYAAKDFLLDVGLSTNYYHPAENNEWFASSSLVSLDSELIPNNISYYVEGDESKAKTLKLLLNINTQKNSYASHIFLLNSAKKLIKNALDLEIPSELESAIMNGVHAKIKLGNSTVCLERNDWTNNHSGGYDLKFVLSYK